MKHLCITVRWLDSRYHGLLGRDGPPEWPPSPFRLFQALVAGVARRGELDGEVGDALGWLQSRAPIIIAPRSQPGQVVTRFVPNNDGDRVPDRQKRLTAKTSRPTIMLDRPEVHYVWRADEGCPHERLVEASRCLCCLGWGIDMAHADGALVDERHVEALKGVRWIPKRGTLRDDGLLRVPNGNSMADLQRAHESAIERIKPGEPLKTVHKPREFDNVFYASDERLLGKPYVAFALRASDDSFFAYAHAKLIHIAGMTRCAAIKAATACPPGDIENAAAWIEAVVAGHQLNHTADHVQFSYFPLPSIGHAHADAMVRRVMIIAPVRYELELRHIAVQLDGWHLEPEGGNAGPFLERIRGDGVTRLYVDSSAEWATVTPVILPGHDDHKPAKTVKLIERALRQSGIDQPCRFTWSALPNFSNCLTAHKYDSAGRRVGYFRPDHLQSLTAVHLRLNFERAIPGPVAIGAGRHCGLGIFAIPTRGT